MPIFTAPGHTDCWIDCPDTGSAIYVNPPGVCIKSCGENGLLTALIQVQRAGIGPGLHRTEKAFSLRHVSLSGKSTRSMLLNLARDFNSISRHRRRFAEVFGSSKSIREAVLAQNNTEYFLFSYSGPKRGLAAGLARSLTPEV